MTTYEIHCSDCDYLKITNKPKNVCEECNSLDLIRFEYETDKEEKVFNDLKGSFKGMKE
jgi:hypothetical protein